MSLENNIFCKKIIGDYSTDKFESAVLYANNGDLEAAVNIMEHIMQALKYSDIDSEFIYMLGFYCQICLDTNRNERAICLYDTAVMLMDGAKENNLDHYDEEDFDMFHKLKLRIDALKPQTGDNTKNEILVERLLQDSPTWWNVIKDDKDVYIEIRKNYIDAYYHGGAIIKELKWSKRNGYQAKIHGKYLNVQDAEKYVACPLESLPERLAEIKKRIDTCYPNDSEKGIQAKMILSANNCYIDSEYQDTIITKAGEKKLLRIDLVAIDYSSRKLIFQELKRVEDSRLLKKGEEKNSRELNEIKEQLTLYSAFISQKKDYLLAYYHKLIKLKIKLDLLPISLKMHCGRFNEFTISEEPQLVISDYVEAYTEESKKGNRVKAIIQNLEREKISYSFININIDGYLYKRYLRSVSMDKWNSIFEMIPWIEQIERIDPAKTFTDHNGKRTRPLRYVEFKSASVQLIGRIYELFIPFDWANWKEGLNILKDQAFEELNLLATCKILIILLYYKQSTEEISSLGIPCMASDLEDGLVLKLLKQLKMNVEKELKTNEADENNNS